MRRRTFLLLLGAERVAAQGDPTEIVIDLAGKGQYERAIRHVKSHLERTRLGFGKIDPVPLLLAYLARVYTDVGLLSQAGKTLQQAEDGLRTIGRSADLPADSWSAVIARERAGLQLSLFDYRSAAESAAAAHQMAVKTRHLPTRIGYCQALRAAAHLRLGDLAFATQIFDKALESVPKDPTRQLLFAPRILYVAALLESQHGNHAAGIRMCEQGLRPLDKARIVSRDRSLGQLTLAEVHLRAGAYGPARESALNGIAASRRMFGEIHQDAVSALEMLARVAHQEGKQDEGKARAADALDMAIRLFGDGSPGVLEIRRRLEPLN